MTANTNIPLRLILWIGLAAICGIAGEPLARLMRMVAESPESWAFASIYAFVAAVLARLLWGAIREEGSFASGFCDLWGPILGVSVLLPENALGGLNVAMAAALRIFG